MKHQRPFRLLLKLFQDRFFESDDVAPGGGFQTNITQVLGFLLTSGFIVSGATPRRSALLCSAQPAPP